MVEQAGREVRREGEDKSSGRRWQLIPGERGELDFFLGGGGSSCV